MDERSFEVNGTESKSRAETIKNANVRRVESLVVYAEGR